MSWKKGWRVLASHPESCSTIYCISSTLLSTEAPQPRGAHSQARPDPPQQSQGRCKSEASTCVRSDMSQLSRAFHGPQQAPHYWGSECQVALWDGPLQLQSTRGGAEVAIWATTSSPHSKGREGSFRGLPPNVALIPLLSTSCLLTCHLRLQGSPFSPDLPSSGSGPTWCGIAEAGHSALFLSPTTV